MNTKTQELTYGAMIVAIFGVMLLINSRRVRAGRAPLLGALPAAAEDPEPETAAPAPEVPSGDGGDDDTQ